MLASLLNAFGYICASIFDSFLAKGNFRVKNFDPTKSKVEAKHREKSWSKQFNMLFID